MIDGDARVFAHGELQARLRPFVARRASPNDVDDVLQEIFLRVQRGLPELRDDQRFGPWVYQIARSALADQRRARARHPLTANEPPEEAAPTSEGEERSAEQLLAQAVVPFIAMLPSPYREALTLTELEGLTQKEAAKMLDVSLTNMKSRVQRGRARLRKLLEDCCEIALDVRGRVVGCVPRAGGPKPPCKC
ncbi:MAG: sigma-70 family RNA polymerase sigma factor [Polyangiaceae bacterium]